VAGAVLSFPLATAFLRAQAGPPTGPAAAPAAPATQPGPDTVILTIGDEKVTLREFDLFLESLNPQDQQMARGPQRRAWADSYANMRLLAREAAKRQIDKTPENQLRLASARDQVLATAMVMNVQENIDEATKRKYYEENKAKLDRISARHILIRTNDSKMPARPGQKELSDAEAKAKAEQLIARIKGGEDFAQVAAKESDDLGSAEEGGDLGSFTRGRMVPPFEQAAFALKEKEISGPVRSPFGYHIIQCTGRFDSYDKLADVIGRQLGPQQTNKLVNDLRKQTKIEMNEAVLGPAAPMFRGPDAVPGTEPVTPKQ
jgi:parvulin-like peptidyl-prolyl isomerase